jgi:hypothetical protein
MANEEPTKPALPYFDEYLAAVLRPRVEKLLEAIDERLTEMVWRQLLKQIAADQSMVGPFEGETVRRLLEETLGLRLQARLESSFTAPAPAAATPASGGGGPAAPEAVSGEPPQVVTTRRAPLAGNPLANAVLDHIRKRV